MSLCLAAAALVWSAVSFLVLPLPWAAGILGLGAAAPLFAAARLARLGRERRAARVLVAVLWCVATVGVVLQGESRGPAFGGYLVAVVAAGVLMSGRAAVGVAAASAVAGAILALLESQGVVGRAWIRHTLVTSWWAELVLFGAVGALLWVALGRTWAAQARAAEAEARYRLLAENARDIIWSTDAHGRVTYVSPAVEDLLGFPPDDWRARPGQRMTRESGAVSRRETARAIAEGAPSVRYQAEHVVRGGGTLWCEVQVSILRDDDGSVRGLVGVTRDVSERRAAEERHRELEHQLLQSQKMDAIGKLAGGIAHDFNNYLTAIMGFAEQLAADLPDGDPRAAAVAEIVDASERSASLTRQLLAFSRRQVLRPRVVDLEEHVSRMDRLLRRVLGEHIRLEVRMASDLGSVYADPGQLEQVIVNLALNARDAMPEGGALTVEAVNADAERGDLAPVGAEEGAPRRAVVLSVSDTGTGMDEKLLERVFEPFFTTKPVSRGSGLGLATVYGIVQQSGGTISVRSAPGRGSTFRICLPRVDAKPDAAPAEVAVGAEPLGTETVLLVEDQEIVRRIAREQLRRAGYRVLEAAEAQEALALARQEPGAIHLLLTDVVLPGLAGTELAERLRAARPEARVLFTSGYSADETLRPGRIEKAEPMLEKPFTRGALLRAVRAALDGAEAAAERATG